MHPQIEFICSGTDLTEDQSATLFESLIKGELHPFEIAAMLAGLKTKGERPEEIAGAARALRAGARPFPRPGYATADSCGTGGDGAHTINISTATAFVTAQMGIPMVKHGNRSVSSSCGSADVLELLGVKIDPSPEVARRCLDEVGICFLFAPAYHSGLKHAAEVRQTLKTRTIMNLLGPLANPAAPSFQVMGVYDPSLCAHLAHSLGALGCEAALVVHGDGLDEIAVHGKTTCARLEDGDVTEISLSPDMADLPTYPIEELRGGDPKQNATTIDALLRGEGKEAHSAAVAMNAGAVAWITGTSDDFASGVALARETLAGGACAERLKRLGELSHA